MAVKMNRNELSLVFSDGEQPTSNDFGNLFASTINLISDGVATTNDSENAYAMGIGHVFTDVDLKPAATLSVVGGMSISQSNGVSSDIQPSDYGLYVEGDIDASGRVTCNNAQELNSLNSLSVTTTSTSVLADITVNKSLSVGGLRVGSEVDFPVVKSIIAVKITDLELTPLGNILYLSTDDIDLPDYLDNNNTVITANFDVNRPGQKILTNFSGGSFSSNQFQLAFSNLEQQAWNDVVCSGDLIIYYIP